MFFYHSIHDLIRNLSFYQPIVVHNNIMPEFLYLLVSTIALQYIIYPYPKHHLDQKKQYNPTLILQIFLLDRDMEHEPFFLMDQCR